MGPASEVAAGGTPADAGPVHVAGAAESQRSTGGGGACSKQKVEVVETGPSLGDQNSTTVAGAVAVAAVDHAESIVMDIFQEMMAKLKPEILLLHGKLVAENTAHARASMNNIRLQQDRK